METFANKQYPHDKYVNSYLYEADKTDDLHLLHFKDKGKHFLEIWNKFNKHKYCHYRHVRGNVYTNEGKLICKSFPYTHDVVIDPDNFDKIHVTQNARYHVDVEGTIVRVFTHKGKVYLSTHKKIDATNGKWLNGATFGEMFEQALLPLGKKLEDFKHQDRCYVFMIVHPDNQLTNPLETVPTLLHLETFQRKNGTMVLIKNPNLGIQQLSHFDFEVAKDLFRQGYSIVSTYNKYKEKYINTSRHKILSLLNNTKDLKQKYLELYKEGKLTLEDLNKYLPFKHRSLLDELKYNNSDNLQHILNTTTIIDANSNLTSQSSPKEANIKL